MRKKIIFFQRVAVPYREAVFRELNKIADIIVCFGKNGPPYGFHPQAKLEFPHYKINDWYPIPANEALAIQDVITPLFKFKPDIVIVEFSFLILSNWLVLFLRLILKYKVILWSQGYNRKLGFDPKKNLLDKIRVWWMNNADAVILYTKGCRDVIVPYLGRQEKLFVAQNTLDTIMLIQERQRLEHIGKENIKKGTGFNTKYNLIYFGRLIKDKEPDRLINVFRIISSQLDSVALQIVGDGPMLGDLKLSSKDLNVKFWGNITSDADLSRMMFSCDMMVIPGYLGLAIVYAFCFGIPVVSQKNTYQGPFHSPEIEYVIENKTGFLVERGNDSKMANVISNYLKDDRLKESMKREIQDLVDERCSIEKMIAGFKQALEYVN